MGYGKPRRAPPIVTLEQPWLNVKRFGAKGDGSHDDTTALQAAIDEAAAGAGAVYVPRGEYKLTQALTLASGVQVFGDGMGHTIIKPVGSGYSAFEGFGTLAEPLEDITLANMTIDGIGLEDAVWTYGSKAVFTQYTKRLVLAYLHAIDTPASALGVDFLVDSVIHGCVVERAGRQFAELSGDIGGNGIGIGTGAYAVENLTISDCHVRDCGNNGIMFEIQLVEGGTASAYGVVTGCSMIGNRTGFRDSGSKRLKLVNSTIHGNTQDGVLTELRLSTPSEGHVIAHNHIRANGRDGIRVEGTGGRHYIIQGNHIGLNTERGVRVSHDTIRELKVLDNVIHGNTLSGVYSTHGLEGAEVRGNHIYGNGVHGIEWGGTGGSTIKDLAIRDNHIYENTQHGVFINRSSTSVVMAGNHIHSNGQRGVSTSTIRMTGWRLLGNEIHSNQQNGVKALSGALNCLIQGNSVYNNGLGGTAGDLDGIRLDGNTNGLTGVVISGNRFYDSQDEQTQRYGLVLVGAASRVLIDGNDYADNQMGGLLDSSSGGGVTLGTNLGDA